MNRWIKFYFLVVINILFFNDSILFEKFEIYIWLLVVICLFIEFVWL